MQREVTVVKLSHGQDLGISRSDALKIQGFISSQHGAEFSGSSLLPVGCPEIITRPADFAFAHFLENCKFVSYITANVICCSQWVTLAQCLRYYPVIKWPVSTLDIPQVSQTPLQPWEVRFATVLTEFCWQNETLPHHCIRVLRTSKL